MLSLQWNLFARDFSADFNTLAVEHWNFLWHIVFMQVYNYVLLDTECIADVSQDDAEKKDKCVIM